MQGVDFDAILPSIAEWVVTMTVPPHLARYDAIFSDLRPMVVTDDLCDSLTAAIYEEFSERNLANVLAALFEEDRHAALAKAIGPTRV